MRAKDIRAGEAYAKRDPAAYGAHWGVPLTTDRLFDPGPGGEFIDGRRVLVLVRIGTGDAGVAAAEGVEAAKGLVRRMPELPQRFYATDFSREHTFDLGLELELWTPAQFEGPYEEVAAARKAARDLDRQIAHAKREAHLAIQERWRAVAEQLDLPEPHFGSNQHADFSRERFAKLVARLETLVRADPLIDGRL